MNLGRLQTFFCLVILGSLFLSALLLAAATIRTSGPRLTVSARGNSTGACRPVEHIAFLKVHKAGSTTVMNILQRFGIARDLVFVLPRAGHYLGKTANLNARGILPPPHPRTSYDLLCNHVIYNRSALRRLMPNDTFYFGIVREPFQQFVSAFDYYLSVWKTPYLLRIPGPSKISRYLKSPGTYESRPGQSYTDNRMAYDLGLEPRHNRNETGVLRYISAHGADFRLMLITEYFDESLVLLRRHLCWRLKDMIYVKRNSNTKAQPHAFTAEERDVHDRWAVADITIYRHYFREFWKKIRLEGPGFFEEVLQFKKMLRIVQDFCISLREKSKRSSLVIKESAWNSAFAVSERDCKFMTMDEIPFVQHIRQVQVRRSSHHRPK